MVAKSWEPGFQGGITSFDEYSSWQKNARFGINTVCPEGIGETVIGDPVCLTQEEKQTILDNIRQNITSLPEENPDIIFYYYFPPYSVVRWHTWLPDGSVYKLFEAEQIVIEQILKCPNIKLFSFNTRMDITADLNNYSDSLHHGEWINSQILHWLHDGEYQLTWDNYKAYLEAERDNYLNFDYASLNGQIDYENDYDAAALSTGN